MTINATQLGKEYDIDYMDWDTSLRFELNEAFSLINREVIHIDDSETLPKPPIEKIGLVVGLLTMNEEIEVLVKFKHMEQLTKTEFCGDYILVPE